MKLLSRTAMAAIIASTAVTGCTSMDIGQTMYNGYVIDQESLALIPVGSSREQVLLTMGTPSTTALRGCTGDDDFGAEIASHDIKRYSDHASLIPLLATRRKSRSK